MSYWGYSSYVSVDEQMPMAEAYIQKARKKGTLIDPVIADDSRRKICSTWWGDAWCRNLERYSDFSNRLPRGRRYVKNGFVLDLQIQKGVIEGLVQGTTRKPYNVVVHIDPLHLNVAARIQERCEFGISSLDALVNGQFPKDLQDLFASKEGLFPGPHEIHFDCSCADGASMCKHVAAVMYGTALRLEERPLLLFELGGIDPQSLVEKAIENRLEQMLKNADRPSSRILTENVGDLFGI